MSLWRAAGVQPEANAPQALWKKVKKKRELQGGRVDLPFNPSPKRLQRGGEEGGRGGRHLVAKRNPNVYARAQTKTLKIRLLVSREAM